MAESIIPQLEAKYTGVELAGQIQLWTKEIEGKVKSARLLDMYPDGSELATYGNSTSKTSKFSMAIKNMRYEDGMIKFESEAKGHSYEVNEDGESAHSYFETLSDVDNRIAKHMIDKSVRGSEVDEDAWMKDYDWDNDVPVKKKIENFEEVTAGDLMNNPDDVKLFMNKLIKIDNVAVSAETKAMLNEVIDIVADPLKKYSRKMNVLLNMEADNNGGEIKFRTDKNGKRGIKLHRGTTAQAWGNDMSLAERYVHELIHATTYYAYHQNSAKVSGTISRLKKLHGKVMEEIVWQDLLPETSIDPDMEEKVAKIQWDYMNSSEHALEEFMALGMTNKRIRKKLSEIDAGRMHSSYKGMTMLQKLNEWVQRLIAGAFEKFRTEPHGMKADELLMKLHKEMMEANSLATKGWNNKIIDKTTEAMDSIEEWWVEALETIQEKLGASDGIDLKSIPARNEPLKAVVWILRNSFKLWTNPELRPTVNRLVQSMSLGTLKQTGLVQTIIRQWSDTDDFQDRLEEIGMARGQIEQRRTAIRQGYREVLNELWGRKLTTGENSVVTMGVLKTDVLALEGEYAEDEIVKLLLDSKEVDKAIAVEEGKLYAKGDGDRIGRRNYALQQINGLAKYMTTGEVNRVQQLNAYNIAHMVGTKHELAQDGRGPHREIATIDRLVTLRALQAQTKETKAGLSKLAKENSKALFGYARLLKELEREQKLPKTEVLKGYVRESYDSDITSKIAPVGDRMEWEEAGYELVDVIAGTKDGVEGQMGLYVNNDRLTNAFNTSAMGLTDSTQHTGSVAVDLKVLREGSIEHKSVAHRIKVMNSFDDKTVEAIMSGKITEVPTDNMVAVRDATSTIVSYIRTPTMLQKTKFMGMEMDPADIVGSMGGALHDRNETDALNKTLMRELKANMREQLDIDSKGVVESEIGQDGHSYVHVTGNSDDKMVREIWAVIPKKMKAEIHKMPNGLWVREDALLDTFGFRDASLANMYGMHLLPDYIVKFVRQVEKLLKSIVGVAKVDIIMRTPGVLIGNIVSNTMYMIQMGGNLKDVFSMQATGIVELNRYIDNRKLISKLEAKGIAKGLTGKEKEKLARLKSTLTEGSIGDLIDAGLYQAIVEDVGMSDVKSSNRLAKWADAKLDDAGVGSWVKTGVHYAYMSEKTSPFQLMQRATAYSDFVARYAMYHMAVEKTRKRFKKKNGRDMSAEELARAKKAIIKEIRNAFINYSKPDSAVLKWFNDMGLVMFTKYALRIQKVWKDGIAKHPLRFMLAAVGQEIAGLNLDDIADKSMLDRGPGGLLFTPEFSDTIYGAVVPFVFRVEDKLRL